MTHHDTINEIRKMISEEDLLCQLAEECSELAQAALKLRRTMCGSNPTPVTHSEAVEALLEESRTDAISEYIESVKYELCMINGLEENRKIFEVLDRIGDKYVAQKASGEA